ncbi:hypothetical protein QVD17_26066 [Tagetes erecta]|uniref:Uncharacterized protein n=1 Tax=Tagetes erecta TaxID=13708 RepID=A0AAD8K665_TARER|nr:hypothetical protein QVD17_26066 [Tagetes erecta]
MFWSIMSSGQLLVTLCCLSHVVVGRFGYSGLVGIFICCKATYDLLFKWFFISEQFDIFQMSKLSLVLCNKYI